MVHVLSSMIHRPVDNVFFSVRLIISTVFMLLGIVIFAKIETYYNEKQKKENELNIRLSQDKIKNE